MMSLMLYAQIVAINFMPFLLADNIGLMTIMGGGNNLRLHEDSLEERKREKKSLSRTFL